MNKNKLVVDDLFESLKNLFSGNDILYVSTPINTGERFISWYNSVGKTFVENSVKYNEEKIKNVIEPNAKNTKECIKKFDRRWARLLLILPLLKINHYNGVKRIFIIFGMKL